MTEEQQIRDYIFPLLKGKLKNKIIDDVELIGTGFLIGSSGFAITAAHVIDQLNEEKEGGDVIMGLFIENKKWKPIAIEQFESICQRMLGL